MPDSAGQSSATSRRQTCGRIAGDGGKSKNGHQSLMGRFGFSGLPCGLHCRTCSSPFCASNKRFASSGVICPAAAGWPCSFCFSCFSPPCFSPDFCCCCCSAFFWPDWFCSFCFCCCCEFCWDCCLFCCC